jgi:hypothetical protein
MAERALWDVTILAEGNHVYDKSYREYVTFHTYYSQCGASPVLNRFGRRGHYAREAARPREHRPG